MNISKGTISKQYLNNEAEKIFNLQGFFYIQGELRFRRYLEIKRKNVILAKNDLSVIMMNPGSSKPKSIDENSFTDCFNKFIKAEPDTTLMQIMRVMENCNFNYAKIVNLSDVRTTKSTDFFKLLKSDLKNNIDHSIFFDPDKYDLKNYLNQQSVFIYAWGVDERLKKIARQALEVLYTYGSKKIGIPHSINQYGYYHPLPRGKEKQIKWVDTITRMIKDNYQ